MNQRTSNGGMGSLMASTGRTLHYKLPTFAANQVSNNFGKFVATGIQQDFKSGTTPCPRTRLVAFTKDQSGRRQSTETLRLCSVQIPSRLLPPVYRGSHDARRPVQPWKFHQRISSRWLAHLFGIADASGGEAYAGAHHTGSLGTTDQFVGWLFRYGTGVGAHCGRRGQTNTRGCNASSGKPLFLGPVAWLGGRIRTA